MKSELSQEPDCNRFPSLFGIVFNQQNYQLACVFIFRKRGKTQCKTKLSKCTKFTPKIYVRRQAT